MRSMTLRERVGVSSWRSVATLFDPGILPSADGAMFYGGIQLACDSRAGAIRETGQVWMCRTRRHPDEPCAPFAHGAEFLLPEP